MASFLSSSAHSKISSSSLAMPLVVRFTGDLVGDLVGDVVGLRVGFKVGLSVGLCVGDFSLHWIHHVT